MEIWALWMGLSPPRTAFLSHYFPDNRYCRSSRYHRTADERVGRAIPTTPPMEGLGVLSVRGWDGKRGRETDMKRARSLAMWTLMSLAPFGLSGCIPYALALLPALTVQPWVTDRMEEKYSKTSDNKTPILPPIRQGFAPPTCEDPPDEAQVIRAMPRLARGVPYFYEEFRDDIQIVTERMVDKIDPPRFFPLIGPAQLHHCHWKCTIYYNEIIESGYPFAMKVKNPRIQVIYIDKDHLHMYVGDDPETQKSVTRDLTPRSIPNQ